MARFQTVVRKARFTYSGLSPQQMLSVATVLADDVRARILRAEDVWDNPAPPLKSRVGSPNNSYGIQIAQRTYQQRGYMGYKARRNPPAIRNWQLTGRTLRSLKVLRADQNRAIIGFSDPEANMRAFFNNRRWRQFGVSPRNRRALAQSLSAVRAVQVKAA